MPYSFFIKKIYAVNILSAENIEKTLNDYPLFSKVNLGVNEGEKIGIVGKNGSGKSTLTKVLSGSIQPDEGKIATKKNLSISVLSQGVEFSPEDTVRDYFLSSLNSKISALNKYNKTTQEGDGDTLSEYASQAEDGSLWEVERKFYSYLTDMGEQIKPERKMSTLSGGQQKKVAIARLLAPEAELLILDEPTNHLDIKTIEYLESYLNKTKSAAIIVTHDRQILNECVSVIWELDRGTIYTHPGNFSSYLERKEERLRMGEKEQERLKTILRRELEWLKRGPQARTGKDKNRIERAKEMQSQVMTVREARQREFSSTERRLGKKILDVVNVGKSYEENNLFRAFSYSFKKGDRIGLVGDNGKGKSTLLDILTGVTLPTEGYIDKGQNTFFAYYDQNGKNLESNKTVLEYAEEIGKRVILSDGEEVSTSRFLEMFSIPVKMQRTMINNLSGGERRRVYLLTRLLSNPNFIILDEPTNDLDIETIENLEAYISSFPGIVLISSHDRTFLDLTTDMTLHIDNGQITLYPGSYSSIKDKFKPKASISKEGRESTKQNTRREKKGLTFKEKKELEEITEKIEKLENEIKILEDSFSSFETTALGSLQERTEKYNKNKDELDDLTLRWLELEEKNDGQL